MRASILFCLVPAVFFAAASPSPANVIISNAATANMTCSGGVCAPTAADAVLNEQDLEAMLASGNATVTTTGSGVQAKDIHVKAKLTWSAATTLALDAYHSIEVNAKVSVAGTGGVSLTTNDGGTGGDFACKDNGRLVFSSLSSTLSINGTPYMLVNTVASLASAIAANPSGAFAFAKNYDAKKDGTYGAAPITTEFTGSFNGLGNTISNLSINDQNTDGAGLFRFMSGGGIANIRVLNENVNSYSGAGGLVAWGSGSIAHAFTSGTVTGGEFGFAGGLIGESQGSASVVVASGSAANVSVNDTSDNASAGGLIGETGGSITDSYATGSVSGSGYVGGLVGLYYPGSGSVSIVHSWASGAVSTSDEATPGGGLVGWNMGGTIARSHASGNVSCQANFCGGLVGVEAASGEKISQSFATGDVSGCETGGLVGVNSETGEISNSYASGSVAGYCQAGGLVGFTWDGAGYHAISESYSTGTVMGPSKKSGLAEGSGGLIGDDNEASTTRHAYWDMTTSGITDPSQGAGNVANDPGIKGLSDKKLKSGLPKGFDPKIWAEDPNINGGLPYLINNPPAN